MLEANKINRKLQAKAWRMTKDAQVNNLGLTNYILNSYAFHSHQLINTL